MAQKNRVTNVTGESDGKRLGQKWNRSVRDDIHGRLFRQMGVNFDRVGIAFMSESGVADGGDREIDVFASTNELEDFSVCGNREAQRDRFTADGVPTRDS